MTRRVRGRRALLLATPQVRETVLYALGAAQRHAPGVQLHAYSLEVTHTHAAATDAPGESQLSTFFQQLHGLIARALNARFGLGENFWRQPGSYGDVEPAGQGDLEEQLLYVWTQPVNDGITDRPELWPGVLFGPEDFGRTITVRKPDHAFFGGRRPADWLPTHPPARRAHLAQRRRAAEEARRQEQAQDRARGRGPRRRAQLHQLRRRRREKQRAARPPSASRETLPDEVQVAITPPPGYEHMTLDEVRAHFRRRLDERVAAIHEQRRAEGRPPPRGAAAVLAMDPYESVGDTFPSFAINPHLACRDRERRPALLRARQEWHAEYTEARKRWCAGDRSAVFPYGSYWLPHFHGAEVAAPPRAPPAA